MKARHLIVALSAVAAIAIALILALGGNDGGPHSVTITLGGFGHKQITLAPPAQEIAKTQAAQDAAGNEQAAHSDLRTEPPASQTPQVLAHERELTPAGQPVPPAHPPLATVHQAGCRTLPVRNYSSRSGSPILLIVLHFTVSSDSGWNGVLANVRWFDSAAAQASSNYIVARTGECAYIVPESLKAWAQAAFNRVALSIEVTNTGKYPTYVLAGGRARLVQLLVAMHDRWKIPLQHGAVSGYNVTRPGVVEHFDLKGPGGGHVDDSPYHAEVDSIIRAAAKVAAGQTELGKAKRSHVIVHAKIARDCRRRAARSGPHCRALLRQNTALHTRWGAKL